MSCQADDLLNANHLIFTNHSAYQLIFIIQLILVLHFSPSFILSTGIKEEKIKYMELKEYGRRSYI